MAHEIESMIYVGQKPWHGLGVEVQETISTREAIQKAGLDWSVRLDNLMTSTGVIVDHCAAVRESDGRILGVVGPAWRPLQNVDAFGWFDPFLSTGEATLETAMSLRNGERVAILARIKSDPIVIVPQSDDCVERFILLSNAHDGKMAIRVGFTPVRVVCANTLAMAHASEASKLLRVFHTGRTLETLNEIREVMNVANSEFEATAEQFRTLAAYQISSDDLKRYVKRVFKTKIEVVDGVQTEIAVELSTESERKGGIFDKIVPLFESGRGNDLPGVKGTWWAAYNAVTEYLSHERGSDQSTRVNSLLFGGGSQINRRALTVANEMAQAA